MSTDQLDLLRALELEIEQHVGWILDCAGRCPCGGGVPWNQVLAYYGVAADPPAERLGQALASGQARGATEVEVRRVVEAMLVTARAHLERLSPSAGVAAVPLDPAQPLRARLSALADQVVARHVAEVCPARAVASGIGQIFANARTTTAEAPYAKASYDPTRVFECPHCGGPQEVPLNFMCRFCGGSMAQPQSL